MTAATLRADAVGQGPTDLEYAAALLAREIGSAQRVVALTGAGLSTECGVPDYRSPDSPWRRNPPIPFAAYLRDPDLRREAWRRKFAMDDVYAGAVPGRGHRALARLQEAGRLQAIVTQNIDGLQQAAGTPASAIVELHGNGTYAACLDCGTSHDLTAIRQAFDRDGRLPACACGGIVKPASISFGQPIPPESLRRALDAVLACDLILVIGCSLAVRPAARLPDLALQNEGRLAVINRTATPVDHRAHLVVREDIGSVLEASVV